MVLIAGGYLFGKTTAPHRRLMWHLSRKPVWRREQGFGWKNSFGSGKG